MNPTSSETPESSKPNRILVSAGIAAGVLAAGLAVALIALYIANFNLLEWIE
jgi:hypothetical protein